MKKSFITSGPDLGLLFTSTSPYIQSQHGNIHGLSMKSNSFTYTHLIQEDRYLNKCIVIPLL